VIPDEHQPPTSLLGEGHEPGEGARADHPRLINLCRIRHKSPHADIGVMPSRAGSLVVAGRRC
jgi:hypothetical protein